MMDDLPAPVLEGLADTLWQERHMVEALLYRMVTAKLLLAADEHRFVSAAMDEVEAVVASLRAAEEDRVRALVEVADRLEVPVEDLTLAELARRAPTPMRMVFEDHRRAFLDLTTEIEETADANRHLASSALGRVRRSLDAHQHMAASGGGLGGTGEPLMDLHVEEATYRAALRVRPVHRSPARPD